MLNVSACHFFRRLLVSLLVFSERLFNNGPESLLAKDVRSAGLKNKVENLENKLDGY